MKNLLLIILLPLLLLGCDAGQGSTSHYSKAISTIPELSDCTSYLLNSDHGFEKITVIRCPNSTTTTKSNGKSPQIAVVIDGVKYIQTN